MLECELVPLPSLHLDAPGKTRFGRYHGGCFWDIKNFGKKRWVVAAYIDVKDKTVFEDMCVEDVAKLCTEFLNQPPPRKKYAKKIPKPKYGKLEFYKGSLVDKGEGSRYISTLFIVNSRKNKLFWGRGTDV